MSQVPPQQMPPAAQAPKAPRKSGGSLTLVLVAVGLGLFTVILNTLYISQIRSEVRGKTVKVYRVIKPLEPGAKLREKDLVEEHIPEQYASSLVGLLRGEDLRSHIGDPIKREVRQNEYLNYDMFRVEGGLREEIIPEGNLAVPIPVNARTGVAGLLRPDMYIDIYATIPEPGKVPQTKPVIERVKVLAVGSTTSESGRMSSSFGALTVALEPTEARQMVAIAKAVTKDGFDIVVRRPDDKVTKFQGKVNPDVLEKLRIER